MKTWRDWMNGVIDGWFPLTCAYCLQPISDEGLCCDCMELGRGLLTVEPKIDLDGMEVFVAYRYEGIVQELVQRLKYGKDMHAGTGLTHLMRMAWTSRAISAPDLVLPMPLSVIRRAERGFNQTEIVAKPLAASLGVICTHAGLKRTHRPRQASLGRQARLTNVVGSFRCTRPCHGDVLVVDDVLTTGATLLAARDALIHAGANSVRAAVIAQVVD